MVAACTGEGDAPGKNIEEEAKTNNASKNPKAFMGVVSFAYQDYLTTPIDGETGIRNPIPAIPLAPLVISAAA
jgi:hypothetical protein